MIKYIIFFTCIQLINVVLNTLKTIITAKSTKIPAAIINAVTYGFYTVVIVFTADSMNIWIKIIITMICNVIGVYFSMWLLEKIRKDKLWEIVATVKDECAYKIVDTFNTKNISYTWQNDNTNHVIFHIYSPNHNTSAIIKEILNSYNAHYIVHQEEVRL